MNVKNKGIDLRKRQPLQAVISHPDVPRFTCCGIVELSKNLLLQEDYEYACLGELSTDVLEKAFGKLS